MTRPTAAAHRWPYHHRTVEQVDRDAENQRQRRANRKAAEFGREDVG